VAQAYHAAWLCLPPSALDEPGIRVVTSPERDRQVAGYAAAVPLFAMVRPRQLLLSMGARFAERHAAQVAALRGALESLSADQIDQPAVDAILRDAGFPEIGWAVKFHFTGSRPPGDAAAVCLQVTDYSLYESFFRKLHPQQMCLDWLPDYFRSICARRCCWAAMEDGRIVSMTDAPTVPYLADAIVEIGVNTLADYRRRGYARRVCLAALAEILRQGKTPVWSCRTTNAASRALAVSVGFRQFGLAATVRA
jgi:GNAT superfamily N-acetyltransferase